MKKSLPVVFIFLSAISFAQNQNEKVRPVRTEVITPIHKTSFNDDGKCRERKQGGNPRMKNGYLIFDGAMDGNRQVDPQIAVGGGYILHGTNGGLVVYNKKGEYLSGISQKCFCDGIDPKLFYDAHNKVFGFDLWVYWDKAKVKPVNISISETSNPLGAWNTYQVSASKGVDGGGIGYSRQWIGYSFPGGSECTFVLRMADAKLGKPAKVWHFNGSLGHPVCVQDAIDDLYFFEVDSADFTIRKVTEENQEPVCITVSKRPHHLKYVDYPPQSPQLNTTQKVSSGDRNPKNVVLQTGCLWFSQAVDCEGRAAVQWHQVKAKNGEILQTGLIRSETSSYIQTTLAVNKFNDVLIGFQEVSDKSFVSPRFTWRRASDKKGTVREIIHLGEGRGATDGAAWGDYSGSMTDGDNQMDLWTIQSIANEKGHGETVIALLPMENKKEGRKRPLREDTK